MLISHSKVNLNKFKEQTCICIYKQLCFYDFFCRNICFIWKGIIYNYDEIKQQKINEKFYCIIIIPTDRLFIIPDF